MNNMMEQLKNALSPEMVNSITEVISEPKEKITKALGGMFPVLVGAVIKRGESDSNFMQQITDLVKNHTPLSQSGNLRDLLNGNGDLANQANKFISMVFGNKTNEIQSVVSSFANIKGNTTASLMKVAAAVVMAELGKVASQNNFSAASLLSTLKSQKMHVLGAAPASLLATLGLDKLEKATERAKDKAGDVANNLGKNHMMRNILLILALLIIGFFLIRSCSKDDSSNMKQSMNQLSNEVSEKTAQLSDKMSDVAQNVSDSTKEAMDKAKDSAQNMMDRAKDSTENAMDRAKEAGQTMWAHLGALTAITLPNGTKLDVPQNGVENKLLSFIQDNNRAVDTKTWLSFDRLVFNTGSTSLAPQSDEQLKNIAQILKAYPQVNMLIGGHTDNTGSADRNVTLSKERADVVKNGLVNLGIDAQRLETKGYGQEVPVATNDTEEGRAMNRRIDMLITHK